MKPRLHLSIHFEIQVFNLRVEQQPLNGTLERLGSPIVVHIEFFLPSFTPWFDVLVVVLCQVEYAFLIDLLKNPWRLFVEADKDLHHHGHIGLVEHSNSWWLKHLQQVLTVVLAPQVWVEKPLQR